VTGLDTNVLLRFFLNDDPMQSPKTRRIMNSLSAANPGWISLATVLEFVWVLKTRNRSERVAIATALDRMLSQDAFVIEQAAVVARAVRCFRASKADFADCLIAESAKQAGCSRTLTFDEVAARDAGMQLIV